MSALSLANYWHPIAMSREVVEQPKSFTLLGERLVAFCDEQGPSVFKDLCIHRGRGPVRRQDQRWAADLPLYATKRPMSDRLE
jgi:phenylpropionate dioxygenase-like ring-hydroxylating dioxygenase large terminal subunit